MLYKLKCQRVINYSVNTNYLHFHSQDSVIATVECNQPDMFDSPEFSGRQRSRENRMPPGGLGQKSSIANDQRRNVKIVRRMVLE